MLQKKKKKKKKRKKREIEFFSIQGCRQKTIKGFMKFERKKWVKCVEQWDKYVK